MNINECGDGSEKKERKTRRVLGIRFCAMYRFSLECIIAQTAAAALPTIPTALPTIPATTTTAASYRPPPEVESIKKRPRTRVCEISF